MESMFGRPVGIWPGDGANRRQEESRGEEEAGGGCDEKLSEGTRREEV